MEAQIQYARTTDGVNIAYAIEGDGPAVVYMPLIPWTHLERDRALPWNDLLSRTSEERRTLRYDSRGSGLSDAEASDYSLDGHVRDLEAVTASAGLDTFALVARSHSGPVGIAYAARHPNRVSHLVLIATHASGADYMKTPRTGATFDLMDTDWDLFADTAARFAFGFADEASSQPFAEVIRASTTAEIARKIYDEIANTDVSDLLGAVRAPTLVVRIASFNHPEARARHLASGITGAKLVMSEDWRDASALVADFLVGKRRADTQPSSPLRIPTVHTILFTDVEGSTALTQRLGDAKAREIMREHERITRQALAAHGGAEVKTMGDGFMTSFASATAALECAIAIQRAFDNWNAHVGAQHAAPISVRIGLNAGEPIAEDEDLFGTAVNMAARICARADGGQILAPVVVRELVAGKGFLLSDIGDTELRGFEDPVRLYEVSWRG